MLAIGVGCFWFSPKATKDAVKSLGGRLKNHLSALQSALEAIDNISDLELPTYEEAGFGWDLTSVNDEKDDLGDEHDDEDDTPLISDGSIEFELQIPFRVQENCGLGGTVEVEKFRVTITHPYHFPVTFIHYEVPDDDDPNQLSPGTAIVIARNFLDEKLKNHPTVKFNYLGPSPFHLDFFLLPANSGDEESVIETIRPGYNMLLLKTLPTGDPLQHFVGRFQDILSYFYYITWRRNALYRSSDRIIGLVRQLVREGGSKWPLASIRAMGKRQRLIGDTYTALLDDKMMRISIDKFVNEGKRDGSIIADNPLYKFIAHALSELPIVPNAEIQKVVDVIEGRRQKFLENSSTIIAGLLGAILGAFLAFAFTRLSGPQPIERAELPHRSASITAPPTVNGQLSSNTRPTEAPKPASQAAAPDSGR